MSRFILFIYLTLLNGKYHNYIQQYFTKDVHLLSPTAGFKGLKLFNFARLVP